MTCLSQLFGQGVGDFRPIALPQVWSAGAIYTPICKAVQALQTTYGVQEEFAPHRIDYERWEMMEEKYPSLADEMGRKSMLIGLNMFSTTSENGHAPKWHKHAAAWADDLHLKVVLKLWNRKRNGSAQAAVECYFFSRSFGRNAPRVEDNTATSKSVIQWIV